MSKDQERTLWGILILLIILVAVELGCPDPVLDRPTKDGSLVAHLNPTENQPRTVGATEYNRHGERTEQMKGGAYEPDHHSDH